MSLGSFTCKLMLGALKKFNGILISRYKEVGAYLVVASIKFISSLISMEYSWEDFLHVLQRRVFILHCSCFYSLVPVFFYIKNCT